MIATYKSYSLATSTNSTVVITKPSGLAVNDMMIAVVHSYGAGTTQVWTPPSGWTSFISTGDSGGGSGMSIQTFWKYAVSADVSATDFSFAPSAGGGRQIGTIFAITGVINQAPTFNQNHTVSGSGASVTTTGVTPTAENLLVIFGAVTDDDVGSVSQGSYSIATSNPTWSERLDEFGISIASVGHAFATALRPELTATSTSNITATLLGDPDVYYQILMAFAPRLMLLSTSAVTDIDITTATGNGNITDDGGETIIERGVVWSTTPTPTTSNSKSAVSGTTGVFTAPITGLEANTLYYVRAYGTNASGTTYGSEVSFTSQDIQNDSMYVDINGVEGQTYAVQCYVGGTTGTVTIKLGSTGDSEIINAGAGLVELEGEYGGLNGLTFEASATFDGYIDNVYYVLVLGDATIDWDLNTLTNIYPINSSVVFRRLEDKDFNRFRIYRYLDIQFKDLDAYVTVLLKNEANEQVNDSTKQFLVSNTSSDVLPFINKKVSFLAKNQAILIGLSNNRLNETFTVCQFVVKGIESPPRTFNPNKIISV